MTPWPDKPLRRACVNSFGFGGANACCILDDAKSVISAYINRRNSPVGIGCGAIDTGARCSNTVAGAVQVFGSTSMSMNAEKRTVITYANEHGEMVAYSGIPSHAFSKTRSSRHAEEDDIKGDNDRMNGKTQLAQDKAASTMVVNDKLENNVLPETQIRHTRNLVLLPFSAHDEYSLKANIVAIRSVIGKLELSDLAYTLSSRRSRFFQRSYAIAGREDTGSTLDSNTMQLEKCPSPQTAQVGFVFSGQGAQWAGMGAELLSEYAFFRKSILYQDAILAKLSLRPEWSMKDLLLAPSMASRIDEPTISQTLCTALQIGLVDLLRSWNVQPMITVGHSSGEIAAAYAAGVLTAAEAIVLAYIRGYIASKSKQNGRMLAVGLGADAVLPYLQGKESVVKLAAINSPESVTLSGDIPVIDEISSQLQQGKVFSRALRTGDQAYHSHHMIPLGEEYVRLAHQCISEISDDIASEPVVKAKVWWQSSVTPEKRDIAYPGPSYWRQNMVSPVLFSKAIKSIVEDENLKVDVFIQIGPHPTLAGPLNQILTHLEQDNGRTRPKCLHTLARGQASLSEMLSLCGQLFVQNVSIDLVAVNSMDHMEDSMLRYEHGSMCLDLPTYQYHYQHVIYHENKPSRELRLRKHLRHDILGTRQPYTADLCPSWRNALRLKDVPWLMDHKLLPHTVFPAAGYLCMATEAISQYSLEESPALHVAGYSLRKISILSALQIPEDDVGIDTLLSMQPVDWDRSRSLARWWRFAISSSIPESDTWTEHCTGQVRIETKRNGMQPLVDERPHLRQSDMEVWYQKFAEHGIHYGPSFRGVSNLRTHYREMLAMADVILKPTKHTTLGESGYSLHPAALDTCLQLGLVSSWSGQVEDMKHVYVPVAIDNVSLWLPDPNLESSDVGQAIAVTEARGLRTIHGKIQLSNQHGAPLLQIVNLRCKLYAGRPEHRTIRDYPREPYFRLRWKPDIESLSNQQARRILRPEASLESIVPLLTKAERLATYLIIQIATSQDVIPQRGVPDHLHGFLQWIERCLTRARTHDLPFGFEALSACQQSRSEVIDSLSAEMNDHIEVRLVKRLCDNLPGIFANETSSLEVALEDNLLTEVYQSGIISYAYPQFVRILELLGHKNPRMRILEIGAGTGGATRFAMQALCSVANSKSYKDYTFTDVSTSFFAHAQKEFASRRNLTFKKLDIGKDPFEQGFDSDYELAIASQSLHTTPNLAETIRNVRKVLRPGGRLLLLEITREVRLIGLIFGTFPDYWNGADDGRGDMPFISKEQWSDLLANNGFSGIDIVLDDLPEPIAIVSTILTTAVEPTISPQVSEPSTWPYVCVVYSGKPSVFADTIKAVLHEKRVYGLDVPLSDARTLQSSRTICCTDFDGSPLSSTSHAEFEAARALILRAETLVWVSAGGLMKRPRATAALIQGLMTSVAIERPSTRYATVDLEPDFDQRASAIARAVVEKEALLHVSVSMKARDTNYVMEQGCLNISRMIPDHVLNEQFRLREDIDKQTDMLQLGEQSRFRVELGESGSLDSICFRARSESIEPLPEDFIEMKVLAMSLYKNVCQHLHGRNRADICTQAITASSTWSNDILSGMECSGVVQSKGSTVSGLNLGDRVWGFAYSHVSNLVRVPAKTVRKMSPTDSFKTMAAIPVEYITVIYALTHLARLTEGDTVLIDGENDALMVAAICVARQLRVRWYVATAMPDRMEALATEYHVPLCKVFLSSEISVDQKLMEAIDNKGLDVLLTASNAKSMDPFYDCIAPMGRIIEVRPDNVQAYENRGLDFFHRNISFLSLDIRSLYTRRPGLAAELMNQLEDIFHKETMRPKDLGETFDIAELQQALVHLSTGSAVEKVIVTLENPESLLKMTTSTQLVTFKPEAAYILVGGLGGLGRSLSTWMADRGARHLYFLSRSGAYNSEAQAVIHDLNARGVMTQIYKGDVSVKIDVQTLVSHASRKHPIKGIIHAAMVLEDMTFEKTTFEQFQRILAPKVQGSINLHEVTYGLPLDFFIMTTSFVPFVGSATQAAYSAATSFQDYFARWRLSLNLPATAYALGVILEVGSAVSPEVQRTMRRNHIYGTSEAEFLKLMEAAFVPQPLVQEPDCNPTAQAHLVTGFEPGKLVEMYAKGFSSDIAWPSDPRHSILMQRIQDLALQGTEILSVAETEDPLKDAAPAESGVLVLKMTMERLSKLLFIATEEIDPEKGLSDYGMDSMIAAELRNWLWKTFSLDIPFLDLLEPGLRIGILAEKALEARLAIEV
ncbi:MAG: hypothetical protein Q9199_001581 [Rusavskia elegans]